MTNMIERVAQAILAKDPEGMFSIHCARVYAKAAIAAMREPTEAMVEAGYYDAMAEDAKATFTAMIDAALERSTKPDGQ